MQNTLPLQETLEHLRKLRAALVGLDARIYDEPASRHFSSIGAHVRHILDHFEVLVEAGEESHPVVDYQQRQRDTPAEHCPDKGLARLDGLVARAVSLQARVRPTPLVVRQAVGLGSAATPQALQSSWERECAFVTSHTVHHMAAIAFVAETHGSSLPDDFGVAASTMRYRTEPDGDEST